MRREIEAICPTCGARSGFSCTQYGSVFRSVQVGSDHAPVVTDEDRLENTVEWDGYGDPYCDKCDTDALNIYFTVLVAAHGEDEISTFSQERLTIVYNSFPTSQLKTFLLDSTRFPDEKRIIVDILKKRTDSPEITPGPSYQEYTNQKILGEMSNVEQTKTR